MAYHPLKKFRRKELRDELDILMAEQLNAVVRGEISSEDARAAFFRVIEGRFGKRTTLKHRKEFQRNLLLTVLGGVPEPGDDDLDHALIYLRRRVLKGSLSLPEALERLSKATRFLEADAKKRWREDFEADVLGPNGVALTRAPGRRER